MGTVHVPVAKCRICPNFLKYRAGLSLKTLTNPGPAYIYIFGDLIDRKHFLQNFPFVRNVDIAPLILVCNQDGFHNVGTFCNNRQNFYLPTTPKPFWTNGAVLSACPSASEKNTIKWHCHPQWPFMWMKAACWVLGLCDVRQRKMHQACSINQVSMKQPQA